MVPIALIWAGLGSMIAVASPVAVASAAAPAPAGAAPAGTAPAGTAPAGTEPARSGLARSGLARIEPDTSGRAASGPAPAGVPAAAPPSTADDSLAGFEPWEIGLYSPVRAQRVFDTRSNRGALRRVPTRRVRPGTVLRVDFNRLPGVNTRDVVTGFAVNVTSVNAGHPGYVTAYECGQTPNTATLNARPGPAVPNMTVISIDRNRTDLQVCFIASMPVDIVVDLMGYFAATHRIGQQPVPGRWNTLGVFKEAYGRIFDTRGLPNSVNGEPRPVGKRRPGRTTRVTVFNGPWDGVAVAFRITATESEGRGFVRIWNCAQPEPNTAALNPIPGEPTSNMVYVPWDEHHQRICIRTSVTTHLVLDKVAHFGAAYTFYYGGGANPSDGGRYRSVAPWRLWDTRPGLPDALPDGWKGVLEENTYVVLPWQFFTDDEHRPYGAVINLTTLNSREPGYIAIEPCVPPDAFYRDQSANNYAGDPWARAALAHLTFFDDPGGACVGTVRTVDVVIDVLGVFAKVGETL